MHQTAETLRRPHLAGAPLLGSAAVRRAEAEHVARERAAGGSEAAIAEGAAAAGVARRDFVYKRALAYADMVAAGAAVLLGLAWLGDDTLTLAGCLALPLVVVLSKLTGLYDRDENRLNKTTLDEAPGVFQVATLYTLVTWLAEGVVVDGALGHSQVLGLWALLGGLMLAGRGLARRAARGIAAAERCVVVGDVEAAEWLSGRLAGTPGVKAEVVDLVPVGARGRRRGDAPSGDRLAGLRRLLAAGEVDRVVVAGDSLDAEATLEAIRLAKAAGVRISVMPRLFEVVGSSVDVDAVDGVPMLGLRRQGLSRSSRALKRALDFMGSALILLAAAPVMAAISWAIKLDSPGPVLFRQPRAGRSGRPFDVLKFRTMVDGADAQRAALAARNEARGGLFKIADDPRITRVGRFLRKTSLDELPQLLNVLKGDMSLVGPRPLVLDEDALIQGWSRTRSDLTPGMTGPWQVLGSSRIPLPEMVKIDYLYGANWTLWQDVKVLLRTVPCVVGRRGL